MYGWVDCTIKPILPYYSFSKSIVFPALFQVEIKATDNQKPVAKFGSTLVYVTVTRDKSQPTFGGPYRPTITENKAINDTVVIVKATDDDIRVSSNFSLIL